MKPIAIFTILVFIIFTIDSCHSQGGGGISANIAAYLTLYREREKKRKEAMKNKNSEQHRPPPNRYDDSGPDYYESRPVVCTWFTCY